MAKHILILWLTLMTFDVAFSVKNMVLLSYKYGNRETGLLNGSTINVRHNESVYLRLCKAGGLSDTCGLPTDFRTSRRCEVHLPDCSCLRWGFSGMSVSEAVEATTSVRDNCVGLTISGNRPSWLEFTATFEPSIAYPVLPPGLEYAMYQQYERTPATKRLPYTQYYNKHVRIQCDKMREHGKIARYGECHSDFTFYVNTLPSVQLDKPLRDRVVVGLSVGVGAILAIAATCSIIFLYEKQKLHMKKIF